VPARNAFTMKWNSTSSAQRSPRYVPATARSVSVQVNGGNPQYLNERVRGTGGFDVTSFGEENLLDLAIDRYDDESIAVHEFCHTIDAALGRIDPPPEKAIPVFMEALKDKNAGVRMAAATSLGQLGAEAKEAIPALRQAQNDKDRGVSRAAGMAIRTIQTQGKK